MSELVKFPLTGIAKKFPSENMAYYTHSREADYHTLAFVPTSVYCPLRAEIVSFEVFNSASDRVDFQNDTPYDYLYVRLSSLPTWDEVYKCLSLKKEDEKRVLEGIEKLEQRVLKLS